MKASSLIVLLGLTLLAAGNAFGQGTGLSGDYYDNADFTTLKFSRTEPTLDFDWATSAPTNTMGADAFSVRWYGQLEPRIFGNLHLYRRRGRRRKAVDDRKKDLIVTSGGKNIAPAPIELRLKASPIVQEAILIGDRRNFPAVLIIPDFVVLEEHLREAGSPSGSREQLVARADVQALYQAILDDVNVNLAQFEKIKRFALLPKDMTVEGGELTPTLKVRRRIVEQHWAAVIEQLYARECASGLLPPHGPPGFRTGAPQERATSGPARGR